MSEAPLRGVVAGHGPLAKALVDAAETITGVTGALTAVTNAGCDRALIEERVLQAIGDSPALVFVDMATGSCFFAAMQAARSTGRIRVVTGVNLAMLVDFVFHRDLSPAEAAERASRTGATAIRQP
ncbi:MAG: PTS sugar transporter subunit IIA [Gemmatimonadales bacterium]